MFATNDIETFKIWWLYDLDKKPPWIVFRSMQACAENCGCLNEGGQRAWWQLSARRFHVGHPRFQGVHSPFFFFYVQVSFSRLLIHSLLVECLGHVMFFPIFSGKLKIFNSFRCTISGCLIAMPFLPSPTTTPKSCRPSLLFCFVSLWI